MVDDEPLNLEVLGAMIAEYGLEVEKATSGVEAIEMFKKRIEQVERGEAEMYRIVFLDYSMPLMDGPQAARAMRALCQDLERDHLAPYICCCTAYSEPTFRANAFLAGMDFFLSKPVTAEDLE